MTIIFSSVINTIDDINNLECVCVRFKQIIVDNRWNVTCSNTTSISKIIHALYNYKFNEITFDSRFDIRASNHNILMLVSDTIKINIFSNDVIRCARALYAELPNPPIIENKNYNLSYCRVTVTNIITHIKNILMQIYSYKKNKSRFKIIYEICTEINHTINPYSYSLQHTRKPTLFLVKLNIIDLWCPTWLHHYDYNSIPKSNVKRNNNINNYKHYINKVNSLGFRNNKNLRKKMRMYYMY
jgi:hypothetical protein